jgi:hypothetical protein
MARHVSWLESFVVEETGGTLGMLCLYQSIDAEALGAHAAQVGFPADEIIPVMGRVVFRAEQPAPFAAFAAAMASSTTGIRPSGTNRK